MRIPRFTTDVTSRLFNPGFIHVKLEPTSPELDGSKVWLFARVTDEFRLGIPYVIPRVRVGGRNIGGDDYPGQGGVVNVSEFYTIVNEPGGISWVPDTFELSNPVSADGDITTGRVDDVTVSTATLTDSQLRDLGIPLADGATRNVVPGVQNLNRSLAALWAVPVTLEITGSDSPESPVEPFPSSTFVINNPTAGPSGEILGVSATFTSSSWTSERVLQDVWRVPPGRVPCIIPSLPQDDPTVPLRPVTFPPSALAYGLLASVPPTYVRIP